jgi:hypothetical protein
MRTILTPLAIFLLTIPAQAATTGSIAGTVSDGSGGAVPKATVTATHIAQGVKTKTVADNKGIYSFPSLPVGQYELVIEADGFKTQTRTGLTIDIDSSLQIDIKLELAERSDVITVTETEVAVETVNTQLGEVVTGKSMTAVALNGRSFTDLLALQPGIVPMSTQLPDSIVMAGVSIAIAPSGTLNPGNQSISGQREDANGFMVNGGDVKELMNGGTTVVPNLDSIAEFRILTNNFDPEYGNYSGGVVNVVTKSGSNSLHGSGFEFLRNTSLDARSFFSPQRSYYRQNQFGGTIGGPIKKNQVFFFGDYQGTRQSQGVETGLIPVPTLANRSGNLFDQNDALTGQVSGPHLANLLTQRLGYSVAEGEPYYKAGCTTATCVFPGAVIPQRAWSEPAKHLLQYIPSPNLGGSTFSSAAYGKQLRDDKWSNRMDASSDRYGLFSAYYYFDDYHLDNPYPTGQGGSSVPGFNGLNSGRSQLINLGHTKAFGPNTVNELRISAMRSANVVGKPLGGVGPTLASQGFVTPDGAPGIVPLAKDIEGIENLVFNSFVMGTPITNLSQANNTYGVIDNISRVQGQHTLKFGFQYSFEQVNVNPNPTFNGSFTFNGIETGSDFADFLIGTPYNYNQADSQTYYGRHNYAAGFAQDSWRVRPNLTFNYGLRWDLMQYWSEKFDQIPTLILGQQSKIYPGAPSGIVYPGGDPGVARTLVPQSNRFSPRVGLAYSPNWNSGILGKISGGAGTMSIRAGYGMFYSVIQGNTIAVNEPQPPFGLSYTSPAPPLFATPFVTAATGEVHPQPFPLNFPKLGGASIAHPDHSPDFSVYIPIAGLTTPFHENTYPYNQNYFLSLERQLARNTLLSLSYVGSQAHHLILVYSANPGNPARCLQLSNPNNVAPGTPTCGPGGQDSVYTARDGRTINGTRGPFGPNFSNDDYEGSFGNSSYNSFQASLRHTSGPLDLMLAYTYSKSLDVSSSMSDTVDPFNYSRTRALSAWDLKHNFVATYSVQLPFDRFSNRYKIITRGWAVSGITRISTGFPVSLSIDTDNSLQGSNPNGVNNAFLDLPDMALGKLNLNKDPRNGEPYFNTALFTTNALGTPGSASRRSFYGPGALNFDLALLRTFRVSESKSFQFRLESFNTFNHTQFFGPAAVNGDFSSDLFGQVVNTAPPRRMQVALKFTF